MFKFICAVFMCSIGIMISKVADAKVDPCAEASSMIHKTEEAFDYIISLPYSPKYNTFYPAEAMRTYNEAIGYLERAMELVDKHHVPSPSKELTEEINFIKEKILSPMRFGLIDYCKIDQLPNQANPSCVATQIHQVYLNLNHAFLTCDL